MLDDGRRTIIDVPFERAVTRAVQGALSSSLCRCENHAVGREAAHEAENALARVLDRIAERGRVAVVS